MKDIKKYFKWKEERYYGFFQFGLSIIFSIFVAIVLIKLYAVNQEIMDVNLYKISNLSISTGWIFLIFILGSGILSIWKTKILSGISYEFNIFSLNAEIREKGELHGSFFLGIGSINGTSEQIDYYVYYKEGEFGLLKDKIEAKNIEVIQRDDINPSYKEIWVDDRIIKCLFVPTNTIKKEIKIEF